MRFVLAVAAWALVSSFPQGKLFRMEREDSDLVALRAEGRLKAPAWAVREALVHAFENDRISPYLAERKVLHAEGCRGGGKDLPDCRRIWAYERYEPPLMSARDYSFRMEVVGDDADKGGAFELRWTLDESHGAPPEGAVHMVRNTGAWEISPAGPEESQFTYRIDADPGGSVASWIVNMANKSQVPAVIAAVEEDARKRALARPRGAAPVTPGSPGLPGKPQSVSQE
ncbi:MAG: hypothetical protein WCK73_05300 [Deltaproteobacteria bacterium]